MSNPNIINKIGRYRSAGWDDRDVSKITNIVVHHSAYRLDNQSDEARLNQLQSWHEANDWSGLAYHFVITKGGQIYQINGIEELTWTDYSNYDSVSVLVDGYFHEGKDKPTIDQLQSLERLLNELANNHPEFPASQKDVKAHREVPATIAKGGTACCGDALFPYVVEFRNTGKIKTENTTNDMPTIIGTKNFTNDNYKNAYYNRDLDWLYGSLTDRDLEIKDLQAKIYNLKLENLASQNTPKVEVVTKNEQVLTPEDKSLINNSQDLNKDLKVLDGFIKDNSSTFFQALGGAGFTLSLQQQNTIGMIVSGAITAFGYVLSYAIRYFNSKKQS